MKDPVCGMTAAIAVVGLAVEAGTDVAIEMRGDYPDRGAQRAAALSGGFVTPLGSAWLSRT